MKKVGIIIIYLVLLISGGTIVYICYSRISHLLAIFVTGIFMLILGISIYKCYEDENRHEMFDFSEALRRMKKGKKVRRIGKQEYINIVDFNIFKTSITFNRVTKEYDDVCQDYYHPTIDDILATDWEEVYDR